VAAVAIPALICLIPLILVAFAPREAVTAQAVPPGDAGPDAERHPLRLPGFWSVAGPFALGLCAQTGFLTHLVAFLQPRLGAATGIAMAASGIAAVLGRLALGSVTDRIDVRMASAASCVQGGALVLMAFCPGWPPGLFLGVVLFGMNIGNVATFPALIIGREFDAAVFMRVLGLCTAIGQATYAFGPVLVGLLRDMAGYPPVLAVCSGLSFLAALTVIRRPGGGSNRR
jgi:predicted MFS family arabinose efflux permease